MAYVLSLRPHSPLKRSFSDNPYLRPCSPLKEPFLRPICDITARNASACSLYSLGSSRTGDWSRGNENTPPLTSQSLLDLVPENNGYVLGKRHIDSGPRKRTCGINRPPPPISQTVATPSHPYSRKLREKEHVLEPSETSDDSAEAMDTDDDDIDLKETHLFNLYEAIHAPLPEAPSSDKTDVGPNGEPTPGSVAVQINSQPFRRWMTTLRRRHAQREKEYMTEASRLSFDIVDSGATVFPPLAMLQPFVRRTSESMSSSMGCVTAMKSASITIASMSIAPRSDTGFAGKIRLGNRSSNYSEARQSMEIQRGALGPIIDESAWLRSLQRRKVVEELIASEESYIADLKVLINVCWLKFC